MKTKKQKIIAFAGLTLVIGVVIGVVYLFWLLSTPHGLNKLSAFWKGGEYLGSDNVILQTKTNNCGPSALKMIFDHFGIPASLSDIEHGVHLSKNGSSMLALKELAEKKGLKADGWMLSMKDFIHSPFPSLLFVHNDHFIIVDSIKDNSVFVRDPAIGRLKMSENRLCGIWKGETLIFKQN